MGFGKREQGFRLAEECASELGDKGSSWEMTSWRICCCPVHTVHCRRKGPGEGSGAGKGPGEGDTAGAGLGCGQGLGVLPFQPSQMPFPLLVELVLLMVALVTSSGSLPDTQGSDTKCCSFYLSSHHSHCP